MTSDEWAARGERMSGPPGRDQGWGRQSTSQIVRSRGGGKGMLADGVGSLRGLSKGHRTNP
eukprot:5127777-Pyramimonas_sp.AAC.1